MNTHANQPNNAFVTTPIWGMANPVQSLLLLSVLISTVSLFWPVLQWFVLKMSMANGWLHILAFGALCGIGLYRISRLPELPLHTPRFSIWPSLIWITAGFLYLLNEAQVGFNTLSAALFVLFVYGLSGYFIRQALWRSLFIPTSLLILVLPFEHYLDIYLGFPLRLLSAQWAGSVLQHTGLPLLTVESILMIDNRAAIVDLDCSGIKSLWVGLIFYLLLTWIERYRIGWRWLLIGLLYVFLLVLANVARITILVLLELVLGQPEAAGMLHQTLGLLGFGVASGVVWWVFQVFKAPDSLLEKKCHNKVKATPSSFPLVQEGVAKTKSPSIPLCKRGRRYQQKPVPSRLSSPSFASHVLFVNVVQEGLGVDFSLLLRRNFNVGGFLVTPGSFRRALPFAKGETEGIYLSRPSDKAKGLLLPLALTLITIMNLLYQPQVMLAQSKITHTLNLPEKYALSTTQLNPQEAAFFTSNNAQAHKYQITLPIDGQPMRVAMVLVWSRAWKTHHVPENCYLSQGFSIDAQGVWQLPDHALRFLTLNRPQSNGKTGVPQTALYWFQSVTSSTPDYSARVMDNLFHPGRNWVMASLLFERPVTPQQITPFLQTLKHAIGDQFNEI